MESNIVNTLKTVKEVEDYRKKINEECSQRLQFILLCETANNASNKSFGYIKECFEAISPILFRTSEGKTIINKYIKTIKENKNLSSLHKLYEAIRKSGKNSDIDFLINNIASENWNLNTKTISEETYSLGRILAEGMLLIGTKVQDYLPKEKKELDNAITYIAENKKTTKNLAEYSSAIKIIRDNIALQDNISQLSENVDLDALLEKSCADFNKKYSDEDLSDDEISALKEVAMSEDRESVFSKYKNNCIEKISEAKNIFESKGDFASAERLNTIMEQVKSKSYTSDCVGDDICNLINISKIFLE